MKKLIFLLCLLFGVGTFLLNPSTAYAANGTWQDAAHIKIGEDVYIDNKIGDSMDYFKDGVEDCTNVIKGFNKNYGESGTDYSKAEFIQKQRDPLTGDCNETSKESITLANTGNAEIWFHWVDEGTIESSFIDHTGPTDGGLYVLGDQIANTYIHDISNECKSSVEASKGATEGTFIVREKFSGDCIPHEPKTVKIGSSGNANKEAGTGTPTSGGGTAVGGDEVEGSCESKGGPLGWILCPVIYGLEAASNWMDTQISRMLTIDANRYDNEGMQRAASDIRNIAFSILVPIMLVMVISTALGFDFVSAYTVKKALPRLFIAVIFIALSFPLLTFFITFIETIAAGVSGIIAGPFGGQEALKLEGLFGGSIFTSILAAPFVAVGVIIALWFFGGTLLLLAATAFLILMIRQIFVVALLLLAPLAILAWIFPGNDKLWKTWWNSFSKLLFMYPIIIGIITIGRVFAYIIQGSSSAGAEGAIIDPIFALIAYFAPYAFIPFTFKLAGGMFATITGALNDKERGLFDRQRKKRAEKFGRAQNQNMFKGASENSIRGRINRAGAVASNINRAGLDPRKMRNRMGAALSDRAILGREAMMNDDQYTWRGNDSLNAAAAEAGSESELRTLLSSGNYGDYSGPGGAANMERDIAKVQAMKKKYGDSSFRQSAFLSAMAGGTHYDTAGEAWAAAARVSGSDDTILADMVAKGRSAAMGAGRVDIGGAGFGATMGTAQELRNVTPGDNLALQRATAAIHSGVIDSQGPGVLMHSSMKPSAIRELAPEIEGNIHGAVNDVKLAAAGNGRMVDDGNGGQRQMTLAEAQRNLDQNLASVAGAYDSLAQSSPQNARIIADGVMSSTITDPGNGKQATIQELIEMKRSSPDFVKMRREYQDRAEQIAARMRPGQAGPAPGSPGNSPPPPPTSVQ